MKTKHKSLRIRETVESLDVIVAKSIQEVRESGGLSPICAATFASTMAEYLLDRHRVLSLVVEEKPALAYTNADLAGAATPAVDVSEIDLES